MLTKENKSCHGLCEQITHLRAALNWLDGQGASKAGTFLVKLSWMLAWHHHVGTGAALLSTLAARVMLMLPDTLVSTVMSDGVALGKAKLRGTYHQMDTRCGLGAAGLRAHLCHQLRQPAPLQSIQAAGDAFQEVLNCAKPSDINPMQGNQLGISLPRLMWHSGI